MKAPAKVRHQFIDSVPAKLEEGVLYVSMKFRTVMHRCCCGCGSEVVTPLSPTDWKLTFDGVSISLSPSIGNWSLPCRSHYWIQRNVVWWAGDIAEERIAAIRDYDKRLKERYYCDGRRTERARATRDALSEAKPASRLRSLLAWLLPRN
jgi:hypothetical protein